MCSINLNETHIQYYSADITKVKPLGQVSLIRFLYAIENPSDHIKKIMTTIRETTNSAEKSELKKKLYAFTPAATVKSKRCYSELDYFTGLMPIDYDGLTQDDAKELKQYLFNRCSSIIAAWLSPSGRGVRALVAIPKVQSIDQYKQLFFGFEQSEFGAFKGFDIACQNPVLPMFLSYDSNILAADTDDITLWTKTYTKPTISPKTTYKTDNQAGSVERIIAKKINAIHENGHPQLRAAAYALGGYVGAGLIDYTNALHLINNLIDANTYLSTKHRTSDGYKKTAKQMIHLGIQSPIQI